MNTDKVKAELEVLVNAEVNRMQRRREELMQRAWRQLPVGILLLSLLVGLTVFEADILAWLQGK